MTSNFRRFLAAMIAGAALSTAARVQADSFTGIGFVAGADTSFAYGVSADGSTVVGASGGSIAKWTQSGGIEYVGGVAMEGTAYAASADGSVIVGNAHAFAGEWLPNGNGAFRWESSSGYQNLNDASMRYGSTGLAVSDDGTVVGGGTLLFE